MAEIGTTEFANFLFNVCCSSMFFKFSVPQKLFNVSATASALTG